jgi:signal transduction histidine kinase
MVHDFRNLLGTIQGIADLAFLELLENSGATLRMEEIRVACRDGGELCRQMLTPSRNAPVQLDRCDLAQVVQGMETQLRSCISGTFALELDLQPAPLLAACHSELQRIVLNLVKNAAESLGGRPGVVRIRTGVSTAHIGDIASADAPVGGDHPPTPFLIVSDTGRGMDRGRRTSLLKGSPRAARSGSHGLGFASVRRIVKSCGGAIRISSEPGQGTTVLVAFPQRDSPPADIVIDARLNMRPVYSAYR